MARISFNKFAPITMVLLLAAFIAAPAAMQAQQPASTPSTQPDPTLAPSSQQETQQPHGRKYKAPPVTSHIEVTVTGGYNSHLITNAAVIFHPLSAYGKDEGSYEVKTDSEGKAVIDVIPVGTTVILQVIAPGFSTYGQNVEIKDLQQIISVKMERPRTQYSVYTKENDKPADIKPGVLEPAKPVVPKPPSTAGALQGSAAKNASATKDLSVIGQGAAANSSTPATTSTTTTTTTTTTTPAQPATGSK